MLGKEQPRKIKLKAAEAAKKEKQREKSKLKAAVAAKKKEQRKRHNASTASDSRRLTFATTELDPDLRDCFQHFDHHPEIAAMLCYLNLGIDQF